MVKMDIELFHSILSASFTDEYRPTPLELADKMVEHGNWMKRDGDYYVLDASDPS